METSVLSPLVCRASLLSSVSKVGAHEKTSLFCIHEDGITVGSQNGACGRLWDGVVWSSGGW